MLQAGMAFFRVFCFIILFSLPFQTVAGEITLDDLGFKKSETIGNPELQATLEKRTSMLKTHQILALATAVPMAVNYLLGDEAGHDQGTRNAHMALGIATTGLYMTSASFAILAPKPEGIEDKGNTRIHRALAWIHGPLMIITPILGNLAKNQIEQNKGAGHRELTGVAELHGTAATVLLVSYLASIAVMSFEF
jgi:hypothetical protein